MKFCIADIRIVERKRELGDIATLAQSIKDLGLLNPITILQDGTLVAGYHRLEACKQLGWSEIEVTIVDLDTLHAELAEIDENLIRNELHWFDRDKQLARRKEIYEMLHPETKPGIAQAQGMNRVLKNNVSEIISPTFTEDTAKKINQTPRTVELSIQRAKTFTDKEGEVLKRAAVPQTDATKLAREPEHVRSAVLDKITTGQAKKVKEALAMARREQLAEQAKNVTLPETIQLLHGDFMEAGKEIVDSSVDLIFTDPPYHETSLPLWTNLALFAARTLKPGGILLAYSGQLFLPQVLKSLSEHLAYCWLLGVAHSGGHIQIWKHTIWNDWKPLVMYSKGQPVQHDWLMDLYRGDKGDKTAHEWSQGEGEAAYYIEKLTRPGALVVDPMCGSGTIVRAAHRMRRQALGIEIDQERYTVAFATMKEGAHV